MYCCSGDFCNFVDDTASEWIKTSYNMLCRVHYDSETNNLVKTNQSSQVVGVKRKKKNYGGQGMKYDATSDVFYLIHNHTLHGH